MRLTSAQAAHIERVSSAPHQTSYFLDTRQPEKLDFHSLEQAETFSMRFQEARADDALVATGAALAAGKTSLYWVDKRGQLPWFLQETDMVFPHQVCIVEGQADPAQALEKALNTPAPIRPRPMPHNTFIGCMMSNLSKEEYAENRANLQQIDRSLREKFASPDNYCEGINVKGSDSFDTPRDSLRQDVDAVAGSEKCIFYAYDNKSRPSGMWVEAGYAIEAGKPCLFLVPDKSGLPPVLQSGDLPDNVKVLCYGEKGNFLPTLERELNQ